MRKVSIFLLVVLVLFGFYSCGEKSTVKDEVAQQVTENIPDMNRIESLLPASSIAMMKIRNLTPFYKEIVPAFGLDKKDMAKVIEEIGFNPMKSNELNEFGIDHSREFGVVLNSFDLVDPTLKEPPVFDISIFIPIVEGKGIIKKIEGLMQKKKKELKLIEKDGYFMVPNKKQHPDVAFKVYNNYLFVSIYKSTDPKKTFDLLGKNSIADSPLYKKLSENVNKDSCFSFYANFENTDAVDKLINAFKDRAKRRGMMQGSFGLDFYRGYKGFMIVADAQKPDFTIDGYGIIDENAPVMNLYKNVKYCKNTVLGIKESPLLYFSFGVNPGEYYNMIKKSFTAKQIEKFNSGIDEFKSKSGVDLHEIINNLGGNFNYGMYDGKGINVASYNTVFSLSINDKEKGQMLLDKIVEVVKSKAGEKMTLRKENILDVGTLIMSAPPAQFYIGFKDSSLIFSTDKSYYEQALTGNIESGFTSKMDKDLADMFTEGDAFYLSFDEGLKVFENFKPFVMMGMKKNAPKEANGNSWIDKITKTVNYFQYLISSSKREKGGLFKMNFILKTRFEKSFISGIIDIIKSYKKEEVKANI